MSMRNVQSCWKWREQVVIGRRIYGKDYADFSSVKPWARNRASGRDFKVWKARLERRKAKSDPQCQTGYGRYHGWSN